MSSTLSLTALSKTYPAGTHALKSVSFEIQSGEFFGMLGPNGAGKTTAINIITGPTRKTAGKVEVFGIDIDQHPEKAKMLIGVVPQEIGFDPFFTVNEILDFQSGYYGMRNNHKRIDLILEKLALSDKKHTKTRALSGGMRRRLLIAKALVHNPKLLILDEPTAGVDVELRHILWKYLVELNQNGMTILLTTHYLEEAERLCQRIAIINHGAIVDIEKTRELIEKHKKKNLEDVYMHLIRNEDDR